MENEELDCRGSGFLYEKLAFAGDLSCHKAGSAASRYHEADGFSTHGGGELRDAVVDGVAVDAHRGTTDFRHFDGGCAPHADTLLGKEAAVEQEGEGGEGVEEGGALHGRNVQQTVVRYGRWCLSETVARTDAEGGDAAVVMLCADGKVHPC